MQITTTLTNIESTTTTLANTQSTTIGKSRKNTTIWKENRYLFSANNVSTVSHSITRQ